MGSQAFIKVGTWVRAFIRQPLLAQAFAFERDAVGVVQDAVEEGAGQRWVAKYLMMAPLLTCWCVALALPTG